MGKVLAAALCVLLIQGAGAQSCMQFSTKTAEEIVADILKDPNGFIQVRNVTGSGHGCFRYFSDGHVMGTLPSTGDPVMPDEGVIMSNGLPEEFCNNDATNTQHEWNTPGDQDLTDALNDANLETMDACVLEFEFMCTSAYQEVSFEYVFGSDEYPEEVNEGFNDIFAFFLNGENIAIVPGTNTTVDIDSINDQVNSQYYIDNNLVRDTPYPLIEADGFTTKLTAKGTTNRYVWNSLKLALADVNDRIYDSYVLVEAGSLSCIDPFLSPEPSSMPSSAPSLAPSISSAPSVRPSQEPSASVRPTVSSAPSASSAPTVSAAPSTSSKPTVSSEPSASAGPTVSAAPSVSTKPTVSSRPTASSGPSVSSAPTISAAPSTSSKPTVSSEPSISAAPTVSAAPSVSSKPTVSSRPTISSAPSISSAPTISAAPSTSSKPTVSSEPSISAAPTVSAVPTVSSNPTVSSEPSISAAPTVSAGPSASSNPTVSLQPSVSTQPTISAAPSLGPSVGPSLSSNPTITLELLATIGPATAWEDTNKDGMRDPDEPVKPGVTVRLNCGQSDRWPESVRTVATNTTDSNGEYVLNDVKPREKCYVEVDGYVGGSGHVFSPIVPGGNQMGPSGRSLPLELKPGDVIDHWHVGMYEPFSETCQNSCPAAEVGLRGRSQGLSMDLLDEGNGVRDCGWGVWNNCTCQCDCDPGVCLSANQRCYDGCTTHLDFNVFGGCRPGIDCPWWPDKNGGPHCESSANFAGIHNLHETAEICCEKHFSAGNVTSCVLDSEADVAVQMNAVQVKLARPRYYWPDQHGKNNCVYDSQYEDWMENKADWYLFNTHEGCCEMWFVGKEDCPNLDSPATPVSVDYKPDPNQQYWYPHLTEPNCRGGRNYPMWMALSPRHYLYTTPEECCKEWYPTEQNCPMTEDDGHQDGFYFDVDKAFYPYFKGDGCAHGDDYPEWMADPMNRDTHIYQSAEACCDEWFPDNTQTCQDRIIETSGGIQVGGPLDVLGTWYPSMDGLFECIDGTPPDWMMGYRDAYVFDSHAECCKAHWCDPQRTQFTPP